jgi:hypothetical protein
MLIREEIAGGRGQLPAAGEKRHCCYWSAGVAKVSLELLMTPSLEVIV